MPFSFYISFSISRAEQEWCLNIIYCTYFKVIYTYVDENKNIVTMEKVFLCSKLPPKIFVLEGSEE